MSWLLPLFLVLLGLYFSAIFSGSETGLYCVNRLRVQLDADRGDVQSQRLRQLFEDEQATLSVTLIGTNLMNYITTGAAAALFANQLGLGENSAEIVTVAILTPLVFVFGEVTPKNLFRRNPNLLMLRHSAVVSGSGFILRNIGAVFVLKSLARFVSRMMGAVKEENMPFDAKRRVSRLLREALVSEEVGQEQSDLIERVLNLAETPLHVAMIPRNRVTTISATATRKELLSLARRSDHRHVPVFDRHPRRIIGSIKLDQLLAADDWGTVADKLRPVVQFSAHIPVASALKKIQHSGHALGIVTDRAGLILGIITIKDLLEEIVGEMGTR